MITTEKIKIYLYCARCGVKFLKRDGDSGFSQFFDCEQCFRAFQEDVKAYIRSLKNASN